MSDATQGPGWWQASDGKWYPPEQHPDYTPPTQPVESVAPTAATPPVPPPPVEATQAMAPVPPPPVPPGPPLAGAVGPPPSGGGRGKVIAIVAVLAAIAVVAALLLLNRDSDDGAMVAASDTTSSDNTDQSDSTDATTTTKKTTTTTAKTTTTKPTTTTAPGPLDRAKLEARLLSVQQMGDGLKDSPFTPDSTNPEACGQPNTDIAFPPVAIAGREGVQANTRVVLEQARSYKDAATSAQAFDTSVQGLSCTDGNAFDSNGQPVPITIGPVQDITAQMKGVKRAVAVTVTGQGFEGLAIGVDLGGVVVAFQFEATAGAGTETVEARLPVAQAGVEKMAG
jgi:hypothetical protein